MITVGCDPEVFLRDPESGNIVPAIGLVGGSKEDPRRVNCGAFQEDNIMAEINTVPANSEDEWVHNVQTVLQQLRDHVAPLELVIEPWVMLDAVIKGADMFGCSADYNVYDNCENPPVEAEQAGLMRTASGNIHIGYDECNDRPDSRCNVVRALDVYLGVPSVMLEPDAKRRELYGKAGAYRPTPYGVEYRVPSNFWLKDEKYMRWVYRAVVRACHHWKSQIQIGDANYIRQIIDGHNVQEARQTADFFQVEMP